MPQVINLAQGPSREEALQRGWSQAAQGLSNLGEIMDRQKALEVKKQKEKEAKDQLGQEKVLNTLSQYALKGIPITPELEDTVYRLHNVERKRPSEFDVTTAIGPAPELKYDQNAPLEQQLADIGKFSEAEKAYKQKEQEYLKQGRIGQVLAPISEQAKQDKELNRQYKLSQIGALQNKPLREQQKEQKEEKRFQYGVKKDLSNRREKIVNQYFNLDRVFNGVEGFKDKFNKNGKLSAADQMSLIRLFVPLSEVNPGVVREAEADMARNLGGKLAGYQVELNNIASGALLSPQVIQDMFKSAETLGQAVQRGKETRFHDLANDASSAGFGEKDINNIIGSYGQKVNRSRDSRIMKEEAQAKEQMMQPQDNMTQFQAQIPGMEQLPYAPNTPSVIPQAQAAPIDTIKAARQHPMANDAYQWATQHPNDPRAKLILHRLGGE